MATHNNGQSTLRVNPGDLVGVVLVLLASMLLFSGALSATGSQARASSVEGSFASPTPTCGPSWTNVFPPNLNDNSNSFSALAATAPNDVWAVGRYALDASHGLTLIQHWDGVEWRHIPSPNIGITGTFAQNYLSDVTALSPSDAWAVGEYSYTSGGDISNNANAGSRAHEPGEGAYVPSGSQAEGSGGGSLIEHWDGTEWRIVSNPFTGTLHSISAVSANDIWAVGTYSPSISGRKTYVLHWDGLEWSHVPSPNPNTQNRNELRAVAAVASDDVWAVGNYESSTVPGGATLIEHWNGSEWSVVPSPNPAGGGSILQGIAVISANDIWAVGGGVQHGAANTLTLHWDGVKWEIVPSPRVVPGSSIFFGVTAIASNDVWAVGRFNDDAGTNGTLIAHWNGSQWTTVPSTDPTYNSFLYAVTKVSPREVWAAGYYYLPNAFTPRLLTKHYSGSCPPSCTPTFSDVQPTDTFYPFIRCLACRGIISGYADGTFRPNNNITRGQIAKMVANAAGFSEPITGQSFEDVPTGSPFYEFIERLYRRGHMGGYPCGQRPTETCIAPENRPYFRPNEDATRGQLSKIVSNAAGYNDPHTTQFYTDVTGDNPFYLEIMRLTTRGVMSGYPCGGENEPCDGANRPYFRWANPVTRGQASKIVANTFFPGCQTP